LLLVTAGLALRMERALVAMPKAGAAAAVPHAAAHGLELRLNILSPARGLSMMAPTAGCGGVSFVQPSGSPVSVGNIPQTNNVTILLGNGGGGFAQAAGSPVGAGNHPRSVAVGDFNLDGKPDLAVANVTSNDVSILLGNGSGGFAPAAPVGVG